MSKTRDESNFERKEIERLVRKSPKIRPPRKDETREKVKEYDSDSDKKDVDLSMNYKDIGGSLNRLASQLDPIFFSSIEPKIKKAVQELAILRDNIVADRIISKIANVPESDLSDFRDNLVKVGVDYLDHVMNTLKFVQAPENSLHLKEFMEIMFPKPNLAELTRIHNVFKSYWSDMSEKYGPDAVSSIDLEIKSYMDWLTEEADAQLRDGFASYINGESDFETLNAQVAVISSFLENDWLETLNLVFDLKGN